MDAWQIEDSEEEDDDADGTAAQFEQSLLAECNYTPHGRRMEEADFAAHSAQRAAAADRNPPRTQNGVPPTPHVQQLGPPALSMQQLGALMLHMQRPGSPALSKQQLEQYRTLMTVNIQLKMGKQRQRLDVVTRELGRLWLQQQQQQQQLTPEEQDLQRQLTLSQQQLQKDMQHSLYMLQLVQAHGGVAVTGGVPGAALAGKAPVGAAGSRRDSPGLPSASAPAVMATPEAALLPGLAAQGDGQPPAAKRQRQEAPASCQPMGAPLLSPVGRTLMHEHAGRQQQQHLQRWWGGHRRHTVTHQPRHPWLPPQSTRASFRQHRLRLIQRALLMQHLQAPRRKRALCTLRRLRQSHARV